MDVPRERTRRPFRESSCGSGAPDGPNEKPAPVLDAWTGRQQGCPWWLPSEGVEEQREGRGIAWRGRGTA